MVFYVIISFIILFFKLTEYIVDKFIKLLNS